MPRTSPNPATHQVTSLLGRLTDGDANALDRLMPLVHDELRAIARRSLRNERAGHTLADRARERGVPAARRSIA
jgi:hypothetical protein